MGRNGNPGRRNRTRRNRGRGNLGRRNSPRDYAGERLWIARVGEDERGSEAELLCAHGFSIGRYVFVVLFHGVGEAVVALGVGYKIIVVGLRGLHGGLERAAAGVSDGAGRQSGVSVGVIGRRELHVVVVQRSSVGSGEEFGVDDAGVGVEGDVLAQAVVVDAGHKRALVGDSGFFFDDRGHDDGAFEWCETVRDTRGKLTRSAAVGGLRLAWLANRQSRPPAQTNSFRFPPK